MPEFRDGHLSGVLIEGVRCNSKSILSRCKSYTEFIGKWCTSKPCKFSCMYMYIPHMQELVAIVMGGGGGHRGQEPLEKFFPYSSIIVQQIKEGKKLKLNVSSSIWHNI